jgi:hypothetical protein
LLFAFLGTQISPIPSFSNFFKEGYDHGCPLIYFASFISKTPQTAVAFALAISSSLYL